MKLTQPKEYTQIYAKEGEFKNIEEMVESYKEKGMEIELIEEILFFYKKELLSNIKQQINED